MISLSRRAAIAAAGAARRRGGAPAPWTPAALPGIAHWHRGDGAVLASGAIASIPDRVGAPALAQATAGQRPVYSATAIGGQPGAVFTAASMHSLGAAVTAIPQPFSVIVAWRHASLPTAWNDVIGGASGSRWMVRVSSAGALQMFAGTAITPSGTYAPGVIYRGIFVFNGAASKARVNGVSVYAGATSVGTGALSQISWGRETSADYLDGAIGESIVTAGDVTADAPSLAQLEAYLAARYV